MLRSSGISQLLACSFEVEVPSQVFAQLRIRDCAKIKPAPVHELLQLWEPIVQTRAHRLRPAWLMDASNYDRDPVGHPLHVPGHAKEGTTTHFRSPSSDCSPRWCTDALCGSSKCARDLQYASSEERICGPNERCEPNTCPACRGLERTAAIDSGKDR